MEVLADTEDESDSTVQCGTLVEFYRRLDTMIKMVGDPDSGSEQVSWFRISLDEEVGYVLEKEVPIDLILKEYGLETETAIPACDGANGNAKVEFHPGGKLTLDIALLETRYVFCGAQGESTNSEAYYGRLEDGEEYFKSGEVKIESWSDACFAADKTERKSMSGCVVAIDGAVVLWSCKKQTDVSLSTMQTEFIAASHNGAGMLKLSCLHLRQAFGWRCILSQALRETVLTTNLRQAIHRSILGPRCLVSVMTKENSL
uniref:AlNc14C61G4460 protein n=1 Tax=Albugo laibachii Nc14 TaxID=890382 RepID=F0WCT4_9STRA|nr:AlNc14C61G4460 [Albugo laibachii Nc14]|eukprot:CCA19003.1 AlNc14C61G4460 [Albugo laibachii Nc14]